MLDLRVIDSGTNARRGFLRVSNGQKVSVFVQERGPDKQWQIGIAEALAALLGECE
jgi:hypothetical protein